MKTEQKNEQYIGYVAIGYVAAALSDWLDVNELDIHPFFITRGKRKGFLRDRVNRQWCDHQRAAFYFLAINANPYKYSERVIGNMMFENNEVRQYFQQMEAGLRQWESRFKGTFTAVLQRACKDRMELEAMGVY